MAKYVFVRYQDSPPSFLEFLKHLVVYLPDRQRQDVLNSMNYLLDGAYYSTAYARFDTDNLGDSGRSTGNWKMWAPANWLQADACVIEVHGRDIDWRIVPGFDIAACYRMAMAMDAAKAPAPFRPAPAKRRLPCSPFHSKPHPFFTHEDDKPREASLFTPQAVAPKVKEHPRAQDLF